MEFKVYDIIRYKQDGSLMVVIENLKGNYYKFLELSTTKVFRPTKTYAHQQYELVKNHQHPHTSIFM